MVFERMVITLLLSIHIFIGKSMPFYTILFITLPHIYSFVKLIVVLTVLWDWLVHVVIR